ncbi:hypothetical protein KKC97_00505 [bacterium]|nr:hypothetical protein [bacterium]MBU1636131.1 hypothetical protein [bacterium]MBU1920144.1 hypothetical protein [bacterium]
MRSPLCCCLLLLAAIGMAFAQMPPTVAIYYNKGILTDTGDDTGAPLPDGTEIRILWDRNANGPDDSDPMPVVGEKGVTANINRFTVNGVEVGLKAGQFYSTPVFTIKGMNPSPPFYYLEVCLEKQILRSNIFVAASGYSEISIDEWTLVDKVCEEIE